MLYTNTSKISGIAGLLVTVVAVTYCANHSEEIVNGIVNVTKSTVEKTKSVLSGEAKRLRVYERYFDGR